MNKRVVVVLVGLMAFSFSSCTTKEFSSNMSVIDNLVFDNLVDIDDLVNKGIITATVNVLQEVKNGGTLVILKSDGLNVVAYYLKNEISIKGNNVTFGSFTSISTKGGLGFLGMGGMDSYSLEALALLILMQKHLHRGLQSKC